MCVKLPDNTCMESTQISSLNISGLSTQANKAHVFPQLLSANLISMGKLCDDSYHITFTSNNVTVHKHNKIILAELRDTQTGMYKYKLPTQPETHQLNGIIKHETSIHDIFNFLHQACFSPTTTTWCKAMDNNFFISWLIITSKLVRKHLSPQVPTSKGYLDQQKKLTLKRF